MDGQMKLSMTGQMRLEQKMKLAPRMIQSMEILQLPLLALQEKIEQELTGNPVLELAEPGTEQSDSEQGQYDGEAPVQVEEKPAELDKFEALDQDYKDYISRSSEPVRRVSSSDGEPDKKLEAIQNTPDGPKSLHEYLSDQWRLVETEPAVKAAGGMIIDYIDDKGYLGTRLEQLYSKDKPAITVEVLKTALSLVQKLEPAGVGARDIRECLLIQMLQSEEDLEFEIKIVSQYMTALLENRLPEIARKLNCSVDRVNSAIHKIAKFDTSPGLQIGHNDNHPILADIIIEPGDDGEWNVELSDTRIPSLRVNNFYAKMSRDKGLDEKTRQFLQNNMRSAQWLMEAIEQRKSTLLKVARIVAREQSEFLEKGPLFLKPLPMSKVASEVGVHIATVSRAVSGKYVQCPQGILPLRDFFSGGMETQEGDSRSWDAIRAKMQQIIDAEDKSKPLNDEKIRLKLAEAGFKGLARRTVAKYRKLLKVPSAKFRRKY